MTANVVVTCTKRKRHPAAPDLQLRSVSAGSPEHRAEAWIERIRHHAASRVAAAELYAGDHWSIARSLPTIAREQDQDIRLWVSSAGYGLIPVEAPVAPYSATFSPSHPDSVLNGWRGVPASETFARWWSALSRWDGPESRAPRSLLEVARLYPEEPLLVVASTPYLQAMREDLVEAVAELKTWELLSIVSAGTDRLQDLERHLLAFDARLQTKLGGGLMSLNIRVARDFFRHGWPLVHPELAGRLQELHDGLPHFERPRRERLTDEQVRGFIRAALGQNPSLTWSSLLHELRRSHQLACEQKRFKRLYGEVRETLDSEFELDLQPAGSAETD
jgi:hypothetical protein